MSLKRNFSFHYIIQFTHFLISESVKLWRNLTLFVALPAVALGMLNAYLLTQEEHKNHKRPEYIPYDHMRIRTKVHKNF